MTPEDKVALDSNILSINRSWKKNAFIRGLELDTVYNPMRLIHPYLEYFWN